MIGLAARHRTAANLLMALLLVAGVVVLPSIKREQKPDFTPSQVQVRVVYLGGTPEEVEESICRPIEDALESVQGIKSIDSEAQDGVGIVTIEKEDPSDLSAFAADIDSEVSAITSFPEGTEDPVISQLGRDSTVMAVLVGGFSDSTDLYAYCDDLATRLRRLPDVSTVDLEGFSDRQLRVELDAEKLLRHSLSVSDVAVAISAESVERPAGGLESDTAELTLRFTERRRSLRGLENLVVRQDAAGGNVLLGELGVVRDLFENPEERVEVDEERVGRVVVKKAKADDSILVSNSVQSFLEEERSRVSSSISLRTTQDGTKGLLDQLEIVITNGWQGILLVFATLWLFFSPRLAFWVVMSLPVSFLGAFVLMALLGVTINTISLVGFLLALGILMDDGIVIAENVIAHMQRGKGAMQSAIDGTAEVLPGVVSSFLTTLCVLGPLAFLDGDIGVVLGVIPVVLALVLIVSLVEAFWILPSHLGHSLAGYDPAKKSRFRAAFDGAFDWLRKQVVVRATKLVVQQRYLFSGVVAALLIASFALIVSGRVGFQAFPNSEGDVLEARVMMPPGTPLVRTQQVTKQLLEGLRIAEVEVGKQPDGKKLVELVSVRYNVNDDTSSSGPHLATVSVDLLTTEERSSGLEQIKQAWRQGTGDVIDALAVSIMEPSAGGPAGRAIEVKVSGDDLSELDRAADSMTAWFRTIEGVSNLNDDLRRGKQEVQLQVKPEARALGLDADTIAGQVADAFLGRVVDEIQVGSDQYEVEIRLSDDDRRHLDDLEGFRIMLPEGGGVALGTVAELQLERGWSRIARAGGRRVVTVTGDIDQTVSSTAAVFAVFRDEFMPLFEEQYPGLFIGLDGETAESGKTMNSMLLGMMFGLLGVYMLLSFQFGSYSEPLLVMVLIPLSLIGIISGHWLFHYPFTIPSILGFVALSGIVINDSILMVRFAKTKIEEGVPVHEAVVQATGLRFRAVFLTSMTTVLGLVPLLFESSVQAQTLKGMIISVTFGLMATTVLVLLVIPALYSILSDLGLARTRTNSSAVPSSLL